MSLLTNDIDAVVLASKLVKDTNTENSTKYRDFGKSITENKDVIIDVAERLTHYVNTGDITSSIFGGSGSGDGKYIPVNVSTVAIATRTNDMVLSRSDTAINFNVDTQSNDVDVLEIDAITNRVELKKDTTYYILLQMKLDNLPTASEAITVSYGTDSFIIDTSGSSSATGYMKIKNVGDNSRSVNIKSASNSGIKVTSIEMYVMYDTILGDLDIEAFSGKRGKDLEDKLDSIHTQSDRYIAFDTERSSEVESESRIYNSSLSNEVLTPTLLNMGLSESKTYPISNHIELLGGKLKIKDDGKYLVSFVLEIENSDSNVKSLSIKYGSHTSDVSISTDGDYFTSMIVNTAIESNITISSNDSGITVVSARVEATKVLVIGNEQGNAYDGKLGDDLNGRVVDHQAEQSRSIRYFNDLVYARSDDRVTLVSDVVPIVTSIADSELNMLKNTSYSTIGYFDFSDTSHKLEILKTDEVTMSVSYMVTNELVGSLTLSYGSYVSTIQVNGKGEYFDVIDINSVEDSSFKLKSSIDGIDVSAVTVRVMKSKGHEDKISKPTVSVPDELIMFTDDKGTDVSGSGIVSNAKGVDVKYTVKDGSNIYGLETTLVAGSSIELGDAPLYINGLVGKDTLDVNVTTTSFEGFISNVGSDYNLIVDSTGKVVITNTSSSTMTVNVGVKGSTITGVVSTSSYTANLSIIGYTSVRLMVNNKNIEYLNRVEDAERTSLVNVSQSTARLESQVSNITVPTTNAPIQFNVIKQATDRDILELDATLNEMTFKVQGKYSLDGQINVSDIVDSTTLTINAIDTTSNVVIATGSVIITDKGKNFLSFRMNNNTPPRTVKFDMVASRGGLVVSTFTADILTNAIDLDSKADVTYVVEELAKKVDDTQLAVATNVVTVAGIDTTITGVATLDNTGKLELSQLPTVNTANYVTVADLPALYALSPADNNDIYQVTSDSKEYRWLGTGTDGAYVAADFKELKDALDVATNDEAKAGVAQNKIITPNNMSVALHSTDYEATDSIQGLVKVATDVEAIDKTIDDKVVNPKQVDLAIQNSKATDADISTGTEEDKWISPKNLVDKLDTLTSADIDIAIASGATDNLESAGNDVAMNTQQLINMENANEISSIKNDHARKDETMETITLSVSDTMPDINTLNTTVRYVSEGLSSRQAGWSNHWVLENYFLGTASVKQIRYDIHDANQIWTRQKYNGGAWTAWVSNGMMTKGTDVDMPTWKGQSTATNIVGGARYSNGKKAIVFLSASSNDISNGTDLVVDGEMFFDQGNYRTIGHRVLTSGNANSYTATAFFDINTTSFTNFPFTTKGSLQVFKAGTSVTQIAVSAVDGKMMSRGYNGSVWSAWKSEAYSNTQITSGTVDVRTLSAGSYSCDNIVELTNGPTGAWRWSLQVIGGGDAQTYIYSEDATGSVYTMTKYRGSNWSSWIKINTQKASEADIRNGTNDDKHITVAKLLYTIRDATGYRANNTRYGTVKIASATDINTALGGEVIDVDGLNYARITSTAYRATEGEFGFAKLADETEAKEGTEDVNVMTPERTLDAIRTGANYKATTLNRGSVKIANLTEFAAMAEEGIVLDLPQVKTYVENNAVKSEVKTTRQNLDNLITSGFYTGVAGTFNAPDSNADWALAVIGNAGIIRQTYTSSHGSYQRIKTGGTLTSWEKLGTGNTYITSSFTWKNINLKAGSYSSKTIAMTDAPRSDTKWSLQIVGGNDAFTYIYSDNSDDMWIATKYSGSGWSTWKKLVQHRDISGTSGEVRTDDYYKGRVVYKRDFTGTAPVNPASAHITMVSGVNNFQKVDGLIKNSNGRWENVQTVGQNDGAPLYWKDNKIWMNPRGWIAGNRGSAYELTIYYTK